MLACVVWSKRWSSKLAFISGNLYLRASAAVSAFMFRFLAGIKFMAVSVTLSNTAEDSLFAMTAESGDENLLVGLWGSDSI